jgi:hypothetical protein
MSGTLAGRGTSPAGELPTLHLLGATVAAARKWKWIRLGVEAGALVGQIAPLAASPAVKSIAPTIWAARDLQQRCYAKAVAKRSTMPPTKATPVPPGNIT